MQTPESYKFRWLGIWLLFGLLVSTGSLYGQVLARMSVWAGSSERNDTPVSIGLDGLTSLAGSQLRLEEIHAGQRIPVACQLEEGASRRMWWIVQGKTPAGGKRLYELLQGEPAPDGKGVEVKRLDGSILLRKEDHDALQYNHKLVYPPAGVDPAYRRGGFIHPLWSPAGAVLTAIQPKDHYHHYGIWNPWTLTRFEGKEVDFWNLAKKEGTVRFQGLASLVEGPVWGGFQALHDHVAHPDSPAEKAAMHEVWDVRLYHLPLTGFLWDFTTTLSLASESPLELLEYRYGGFGYRATEEWTKSNTRVLTSEGKSRAETDGSTARWCLVSGETSKGRAGILFMSYPANYNYPEPIRMWPESANEGRGDVFFNFSPTKNKNWTLAPNREYCLKYRMLVFTGTLTAQEAELAWNDFAHPPRVSIEFRASTAKAAN
jgi:hypothetical protein